MTDAYWSYASGTRCGWFLSCPKRCDDTHVVAAVVLERMSMWVPVCAAHAAGKTRYLKSLLDAPAEMQVARDEALMKGSVE